MAVRDDSAAGFDRAIRAVREAVAEAHGVQPHAVVLVRRGSLPKTSSGKRQRRATRDAYLRGELEQVAAWQRDAARAPDGADATDAGFAGDADAADPQGGIERQIAAIWKRTLGIERVPTTESFFAVGGDSVLGAQVVARVNAAFGVELDLQHFFDALTVERLAARVQEALIARIDALSDEEAARLLARLQGAGQGEPG